MSKYKSLEELKKNHIDKVPLAKKFLNDNSNKSLTYKSLRAFFDEYETAKKNGKKEGGAKFSERVFSYWTMKNLKKNGSYPEVTIQHRHQIKLHSIKGEEAYVTKKFDFSFEGATNKKVFIEFKCNIDNIEKDLYKFFLLKGDKSIKNSVTAIVIFEGEDNWKNKRKKNNGELSGYAKLLQDSKAKELLDEYFYFPINNKRKATKGIKSYKNFLKTEI